MVKIYWLGQVQGIISGLKIAPSIIVGAWPMAVLLWKHVGNLLFAVLAHLLFLLIDSHRFLPTLVITSCKEPWCVNFCLPPHTTHESQPLDVRVFASLKTEWTHNFYQENPGRVITNFYFSNLFTNAWCKFVSPANVMVGFHKAGVYPLKKLPFLPAKSKKTLLNLVVRNSSQFSSDSATFDCESSNVFNK